MSSSPEMGKKVLNSNLNITNIIPKEGVRKSMLDTLSMLSDILEDHCGPYSTKAMLAPQVHMGGEPQFTTDGINIIKSIEFANPLQDLVQNILVYIGARVDTAGADGTTSSMMIVINALRNLIETMPEKVTYEELTQAYSEFEEYMLKYINDNTIKVDPNDHKAVREFTKLQAMTSSHNNEELSDVVSELFASTKSEAWNFVSFERSAYETEDVYKLVLDDSNFKMKCQPFSNQMMGGVDGVSVEPLTGKMICVIDGLVAGSVGFETFTDAITDAVINNTPLLIVTPTQISQDVDEKLHEKLGAWQDHKVKIFIADLNSMNATHTPFKAIKLLCGQNPDNAMKKFEVVDNVTFTYTNGSLYLTGLYEESEDGVCPLMHDESVKGIKFRERLEMIKTGIDNLKNSNQQTDVTRKIMELSGLYNNMYLSQSARIVIGGAAYDNTEAIDICNDTLGATRNALLNGSTVGGMGTMESGLMRMPATSNTLKLIIVDAFKNAIVKLHKVTNLGEVVDNNEYSTIPDNSVYDVVNKHWTQDIRQPSAVDKEVIKRFGEVALKYAFTSKVIVPHSVYDPNAKQVK